MALQNCNTIMISFKCYFDGRFAEGRELVRILLAAGADATAQETQHRRTALHTAAMANDIELVKVGMVASLICVTYHVSMLHFYLSLVVIDQTFPFIFFHYVQTNMKVFVFFG